MPTRGAGMSSSDDMRLAEARSERVFKSVLSTSGQVRYLSVISFLLATWLAFQAQFFFTVDNFIWLGFHHFSSPLCVAVTFARRGVQVAVYALLAAAAADFILAATSAIMVVRCVDPDMAQLDCPDRLLQGTWILFYSSNQLVLSVFELASMWTLSKLTHQHAAVWEETLAAAPDEETAKRWTHDAREKRTRRAAGVERRLSLVALLPAVAGWMFADVWATGWLCALAFARPLRDALGIWASYRAAEGGRTQQEFYDTLTTTLSGVFLAVSLAAWLWSETLILPIDDTFSAEVLWVAAKSAWDDPFSFLAQHTTARPEPFLLFFALVETLVLCNKRQPLRA